MFDAAIARFTEEQINAARKVDLWTSNADGAAWFAAQLEQTRRLFNLYENDLLAWREECQQRAVAVLRDGHLHQPVPEDKQDNRIPYDIEVMVPTDLLACVRKRDVETLAKHEQEALRIALLAGLDEQRATPSKREFRQHRRDRLAVGECALTEYVMWVELPDEPVSPLGATGEDYASLPRTDQLAIAATVLLVLHANVMPDHNRLPRKNEGVFDLIVRFAKYERGLRLEGMVNLVEAKLAKQLPELTPDDGGIVQTEPWRPAPGYIPASRIRYKNQPIPPSTLNGWRNKFPAAFEKHPATGEWFHPAEWVKERLTKYRPGHNPPNRNSAPKPD